MNEELARRSHALLMKAVDLAEPQRRAFVESSCAGDPTLRARVVALLAAIDRSGGFLETPALGDRRSTVRKAPRNAPQTIGDYCIVRVIGVGGMATVYEAIQDRPRRRVALKIMRQGLAETSAVHRFRYETEVLARVQHPGIAQIFEAGADDAEHGVPTPFFAMEYIENASTITAYALRLRLPINERLVMFAAVCDAVCHGHQLGVIHRDLKPGNILVDAAGRPKVIDFGVARSTDPQQAWITQSSDLGQIIGTLNYMSPEQCSGDAVPDIRTDVYSLGVVMYELLCDRLPHDFSRTPFPAALRIVREIAPPRPSTIDPRLRGDLDAIVSMAIDKEPQRRYATAAALAADIRRFLNDESIEARPPTLVHQCRLFVRRNRMLVGALGLVLLAICGGALLSASFAYRTALESKRREAAEGQAILDRDEARRNSYNANVAGAFLALQSNEFLQLRCRLSLCPEELRGWEWHFLSGMSERSERTIVAHEDMVFAFAASRDGTRLATGCRDGRLRVWDRESGARIADFERPLDAAIMSVAFSPDGNRLVSGANDGTVCIWDVQTSQLSCLIERHSARVELVAWSADGVIASADDDGVARLWDGESGELRRELDDQPGRITGVAFSEDGAQLLTWNHGGSVWLRSADSTVVRHRWSFEGTISCAAFSPDGALVAVGGSTGRVTVWTTASGQEVRDLSAPAGVSTVRSLAFSPRGDRLAAGQIQRGIVLTSVADGRSITSLRGHDEAVSGLWFTPDGNKLFSSSWDRTLRVWDLSANATAVPITSLNGHDDHVIGLAFSPDGTLLASSGRDKNIRLWDPELGLPVGVLRGHADAIYAIAFAPDGKTIASGSHDHAVRLWSARTGAHLETVPGHNGPVWTVAFSPDGRLLASAGDDTTVQIWDIQAKRGLHNLSGHAGRVTHVAFSPDGRWLCSTSRDQSARIWDMRSGQVLHVLDEHEADVFSAVFSHDGQIVYTGSRDQTVRVWDVASGTRLHVLGGHGQFVTSLSLSPDGKRLAAGSWLGGIVLWDLATHELIAFFHAHDQAIRGVAFDPAGRRLASASYDRTIHLFDSAPPEQRRAARARAQEAFAAATELMQRLSEQASDAAQLADAVEANAAVDPATRAWLRKLVLMRFTNIGEQP